MNEDDNKNTEEPVEIKENLGGIGGIDLSIKPKETLFQYGEFSIIKYKLLLNNDKTSTGICHIKTNPNLNTNFLIPFLKKELTQYNIEEAFPGGASKLDFPIFIATTDMINAECLVDELKSVDDLLCKELNNK